MLDELQMLDNASPEQTVMFQLSLDRGMVSKRVLLLFVSLSLNHFSTLAHAYAQSYFKHVMLVSGHQDQYVPLHSALIQVAFKNMVSV